MDDNKIATQDASIPDDWKQGLDAEFISEIENELPKTADDSVKSEVDKPVETDKPIDTEKPVEQTKPQEPDYKQMYENMQRALREEREKNDRRLKELEEKIVKPVEQPKEKSVREEAKERIISKYGSFDQFDEEHLAELAETIADIKIERKFTSEKQEQQKQQLSVVQQEFNKAYQEIVDGVDDPQLLDQYAMNKLRTLPFGEGFVIGKAIEELNAGRLTTEVINTLKPFYAKAKQEYIQAKTAKTQKVEQVTSLPRAAQMSGGGTPTDVNNIEDMYKNWDNLTPKQRDELVKNAFKQLKGE